MGKKQYTADHKVETKHKAPVWERKFTAVRLLKFPKRKRGETHSRAPKKKVRGGFEGAQINRAPNPGLVAPRHWIWRNTVTKGNRCFALSTSVRGTNQNWEGSIELHVSLGYRADRHRMGIRTHAFAVLSELNSLGRPPFYLIDDWLPISAKYLKHIIYCLNCLHLASLVIVKILGKKLFQNRPNCGKMK